jgi:hypothetical protein
MDLFKGKPMKLLVICVFLLLSQAAYATLLPVSEDPESGPKSVVQPKEDIDPTLKLVFTMRRLDENQYYLSKTLFLLEDLIPATRKQISLFLLPPQGHAPVLTARRIHHLIERIAKCSPLESLDIESRSISPEQQLTAILNFYGRYVFSKQPQSWMEDDLISTMNSMCAYRLIEIALLFEKVYPTGHKNQEMLSSHCLENLVKQTDGKLRSNIAFLNRYGLQTLYNADASIDSLSSLHFLQKFSEEVLVRTGSWLQKEEISVEGTDCLSDWLGLFSRVDESVIERLTAYLKKNGCSINSINPYELMPFIGCFKGLSIEQYQRFEDWLTKTERFDKLMNRLSDLERMVKSSSSLNWNQITPEDIAETGIRLLLIYSLNTVLDTPKLRTALTSAINMGYKAYWIVERISDCLGRDDPTTVLYIDVALDSPAACTQQGTWIATHHSLLQAREKVAMHNKAVNAESLVVSSTHVGGDRKQLAVEEKFTPQDSLMLLLEKLAEAQGEPIDKLLWQESIESIFASPLLTNGKSSFAETLSRAIRNCLNQLKADLEAVKSKMKFPKQLSLKHGDFFPELIRNIHRWPMSNPLADAGFLESANFLERLQSILLDDLRELREAMLLELVDRIRGDESFNHVLYYIRELIGDEIGLMFLHENSIPCLMTTISEEAAKRLTKQYVMDRFFEVYTADAVIEAVYSFLKSGAGYENQPKVFLKLSDVMGWGALDYQEGTNERPENFEYNGWALEKIVGVSRTGVETLLLELGILTTNRQEWRQWLGKSKVLWPLKELV